jgi:amidase
VHPEVRAAVEGAAGVLEALGARCEWVDGPQLDEDWAGFTHVWADMAHHYRDLWDREGVHPEVAALIDLGRALTGLEYASSLARAREIRASFERSLGAVDVLLAPATPYPAPLAGSTTVEVEGGVLGVHDGSPARLTAPVNLAGLPALAFPVGFSAEGLPLGAQLIGPPWWDETLLDVGIAYQATTNWHARRPAHGGMSALRGVGQEGEPNRR